MSARLVTLTLHCHQAFLHFQKREIERSNDGPYLIPNHQSLAALFDRCGLTDYGSLIGQAATTTTTGTMTRYLEVPRHTAYGSSLGLTSGSHQTGAAITADTATCTTNSSNSDWGHETQVFIAAFYLVVLVPNSQSILIHSILQTTKQ